MKKLIARILPLWLLLAALTVGTALAAARPTASASKYIRAYPIAASAADGKLYGYADEALTTRSTNWIRTKTLNGLAPHECWIVGISANGQAVRISYPLDSGGRRTGWFYRSAFTGFDLTRSYDYKQIYANVPTFRESDGKTSYGTAVRNDRVYILGRTGSFSQVIYPLPSGDWEMGWARTTTLNAALKINLSSCTVTVSSATYTGRAVTPNVTVKYGTTTLRNGTDYTLSCSNNVAPGVGTVTITGRGSASGTVTRQFTVQRAPISACTITASAVVDTVNRTNTVNLSLTRGSTVLREETDYVYSYAVYSNGGTQNVRLTITGRGLYTGTVTRTVVPRLIQPGPTHIAMLAITVDDTIYTGMVQTPAVRIRDGSKTLTEGVDYTLEYENNVNAGTGRVRIFAIGEDYTGNTARSFTIAPRSLTSSGIHIAVEGATYTGYDVRPRVTVTYNRAGYSIPLQNNTHYTLSYSRNLNAGTGTVLIRGRGNYAGTTSRAFTIARRDIRDCAISVGYASYWDRRPEVTVTYTDPSSGAATISASDYVLAYTTGTRSGTVTIKPKGNLRGSPVTRTFQYSVY